MFTSLHYSTYHKFCVTLLHLRMLKECNNVCVLLIKKTTFILIRN